MTITVGSGLQLFVNGVKVDETSGGATGNDWCGGDGAGLGRFAGVNHGGYQGGANGMTYDAPFIGQMAIVRLYTGVRTAAQIYQNFNAVNTGTDIDGDAITATGVLDGTGTFVPIGTEATLASGALVTMTDATGGFDYNPNGVFSPPAGQPATDTFTYRVTDPSGVTAEATVTLLIIVPTIQEDWRILYYGYFANSGPGADSAMAVNGLTNLQSFALDLDPTAPAGVLDIDTNAGTILSLGPPSIWTGR